MVYERVRARHGDVLVAIACGGALGSLARHAVAVLLPHDPAGFPTATLLVNVLGCLLIGCLMVSITERGAPHRLLRPFLGIGVFGGFTTMSTYVVDTLELARTGHGGLALLYGLGTVLTALLAVTTGMIGTRAFLARARRRGPASGRQTGETGGG